jgi:hypothetical protein
MMGFKVVVGNSVPEGAPVLAQFAGGVSESATEEEFKRLKS